VSARSYVVAVYISAWNELLILIYFQTNRAVFTSEIFSNHVESQNHRITEW